MYSLVDVGDTVKLKIDERANNYVQQMLLTKVHKAIIYDEASTERMDFFSKRILYIALMIGTFMGMIYLVAALYAVVLYLYTNLIK